MSGSTPASLVLISGPEQVLAERALAETLASWREAHPDLDLVTVPAAGYQAGQLALHTSPSLFGGWTAVVVSDLDEGSDELVTDVARLAETDLDAVGLVVLHKSGNRGKRALDQLRGAGARVLEAPALKSDRDRTDFAAHEFRRAGRRATAEAVHALVEACGKDVRELASACQQLVADTTGTIDADVVLRYHGGRVEATGFRVADAAVAGDAGEALRLLRHAIAVGVDPVPIVGAIASQLRTLVRVGSAGRGRSGDIARELGIAPWQVDKARRILPGWSAEGLGVSIQALAAADQEVKGAGRDPVYAVERAILTISREHGRGS